MILDTTHRLADSASCPACGYVFDSASNLADGQTALPGDGAWSVCLKCSALQRFVAGPGGLSIRLATAQEVDDLRRTWPDTYQILRDGMKAIVALTIQRSNERNRS